MPITRTVTTHRFPIEEVHQILVRYLNDTQPMGNFSVHNTELRVADGTSTAEPRSIVITET